MAVQPKPVQPASAAPPGTTASGAGPGTPPCGAVDGRTAGESRPT